MHTLLPFFFFLIAAIYAAAGFGGGSSYLALMSLWGVPVSDMRPTALLCNLVVVSIGLIHFQQGKHLEWKKALPIAIAAMPMAFLGGMTLLRKDLFLLYLGIALILAACLMFFQPASPENNEKVRIYPVWLAPLLGAVIGYGSSLLGIGGGIFLSPVLHLMRWGSSKSIAATASLFILLNSLTGLAAQCMVQKFALNWAFSLPLMGAVLLGGILGSRMTVFFFNEKQVRIVTALVILYAGINLLM